MGLEKSQEEEESGEKTDWWKKQSDNQEINDEDAQNINPIKEENANSTVFEQKHSQDKEEQSKCKCPSVIKHSNPAMCPIIEEEIYEAENMLEENVVKTGNIFNLNRLEDSMENITGIEDDIAFDAEDAKKNENFEEIESANVSFVQKKSNGGKVYISALINGVNFTCNKERKGRKTFRCIYYHKEHCNAMFSASKVFSKKSGKEEWCAKNLQKATWHNHDNAVSRQIIDKAKSSLKFEVRNNFLGKTRKEVYTDFLHEYPNTLSNDEKLVFENKFPTYKAVSTRMWKWKQE